MSCNRCSEKKHRCHKGPTGPQGEQGEKGCKGERGPKGCPGGKNLVNMAFGNIISPLSKNQQNLEQLPKLNNLISNKGIESVELVHFGVTGSTGPVPDDQRFGYKIIFKNGTFNCGPDKRPPTVLVTPCEYFPTDDLNAQYLSETALVWANQVTFDSAFITVGRWNTANTGLVSVATITLDVDFDIVAFQDAENCEEEC